MTNGLLSLESRKIPSWARVARPLGRRWPQHKGRWRVWRFLHQMARWPGSVVIDMPDGRVLEVDLTDLAHFQAYWAGYYEPDTEWVLGHYLSPGDVCIDAGANVGLLSTLAATLVREGGQVHCFEPVSGNVDRLRRNVVLNNLSNVIVNCAALGERSGTGVIYEFQNLSTSQSSLSVLGRSDAKPTECDVVRLDDYVDEGHLQRVRLIKLDVEGAEFAALMGAEDLLRQQHPILLVELNALTASSFGYHPHQMLEWLERLGYQPYQLANGRTVERVTRRDELMLDAANVLLLPHT